LPFSSVSRFLWEN